MSYTSIHSTTAQGEVSTLAEIDNAWRGAMFVWTKLGERYLPESQTDPYWTPLKNDGQPIWDLFKDPRLHNEEKIVLGSTFDRVMIKRENISRVCWAYSQFAQWYPGNNSLMEQWGVLNKAKNDPEIFAVFWTQTSVASDIWYVFEPDKDEYRRYDITRDIGHWFLFDRLQSN
jgi:hypothetical protein